MQPLSDTAGGEGVGQQHDQIAHFGEPIVVFRVDGGVGPAPHRAVAYSGHRTYFGLRHPVRAQRPHNLGGLHGPLQYLTHHNPYFRKHFRSGFQATRLPHRPPDENSMGAWQTTTPGVPGTRLADRHHACLLGGVPGIGDDAGVDDVDRIADELEAARLGRPRDAATYAAAAAGLRCEPDPRCLRADILMRAGRVNEAEPIWAAVFADTPDDVWLYNNAGLEYAAAGNHQTALAWLTDGLTLALDSGDPNRLTDQLADTRQASLTALDRVGDDLQTRAATFLTEQQHTHTAPNGGVLPVGRQPATAPTPIASPPAARMSHQRPHDENHPPAGDLV